MEDSSHFFKVILPETIKNESLELPSRFVEEHGNTLSNTVWLRAPTGPLAWRAELKRRGSRAWLAKGWQDFVDYYSVKCAYFLVFKYEGESCFVVSIFHTTTFAIQFPIPSNSNGVELDLSKSIRIKEEYTDGDGDQRPRKLHKSSKTIRHSTSVADRVLQRAKAYKSPNPYFTIKITPFYASNRAHVYVPQSIARSHFLGKKNIGIHLNLGEDGRSWFVDYNIGAPPRNQVHFTKPGWSKFVKENQLQVGDVCVFELVNSKTMVCKVTLFRVAEYA